jgi:hypothetical protein
LIFDLMPIATGLSDDEQANLQMLWRHEKWPLEMTILAELDRAGDWVKRGRGLLVKFQTELYAPAAVEMAQKSQRALAEV